MPQQTYDTIDWQAEAQRVKRAFGVEGECEFRLENYERLLYEDGDEGMIYQPKIAENLYVQAAWTDSDRYFLIHQCHGHKSTSIGIWDTGVLNDSPNDLTYAVPLARALFHLDLLTPEVETALQVTISHHEKLEWLREYEERYGVTT